MRFHFFPTPAEAETIYSGFCRCAERSGLLQQHIVSELTSQRDIDSLYGALPGYLKRLAASLPAGHPWTNTQRSVRLHTAMPYYTYFDSPTRRNKAMQAVESNDFSHEVGMALGLTQYRCGAGPKHPRFCSECKAENEAALGFSYFRREHQLPGVIVCWKHGDILSHGCRICGPYPLPHRGLSMPGRCLCAGEQMPLPVVEELPGDPDVLKWLATESAYMVQADGTRCPCVLDEFRRQALNDGLCRGLKPAYADIANALERRFGVSILNWLGYPAWTNGRPSAWIRGLLHNYEQKRRPTIVLLLIVGLFKNSVASFEALSSVSETTSPGGTRVGGADWRANLPRLLARYSFELWTVAKLVGVSHGTVAAEAREQGVPVPLTTSILAKLGGMKIEGIRHDLRAGVPKTEIKKKHCVNDRELDRIELDTPGIHDSWKRAAQRIRDQHRRRPIDLKAAEVERHPGWAKELPQLFARQSYELAAVASRIGVSQQKITTEALRQKIRVRLPMKAGRRLGQEKLESIRSDLRGGMPKEKLAAKHGVGRCTIRLIELDSPEIQDARNTTIARKRRNAHRQRILDIIASDPDASRATIRKKASGTYLFALLHDRTWFYKTVSVRPRGWPKGPRRSLLDRGQLDSELAEKFIHVVQDLKSTFPPIRITKHRVVCRAACLKYFQYSADLPKSRAVLNEHVETMPDYQVRKIRWAIAEMARNGQVITEGTVREKTGFWPTVIHQHKQLVRETAQQLGANAGPLFAHGF